MRISDWSSDVCSSDLIDLNDDGIVLPPPKSYGTAWTNSRVLPTSVPPLITKITMLMDTREIHRATDSTALSAELKSLGSYFAGTSCDRIYRKSVVKGKSWSVGVVLCGRSIINI